MKTKWLIILVLVVSIASHFAFFGHPNETVFDEVHFGKFISGYFTHEYFFDIHPPLGKLLISGMGYIGGFKPGFSFGEIGQKFPDNTYLWLRFLPMIAGMLLPLVFYGLGKRLGFSILASATLGILLVLENAFIAQSRFILLDSFLLLFGFLSLFFYIGYHNDERKRIENLILTAIFVGLSISVKWTGLSFLGIILFFQFIEIVKKFSWRITLHSIIVFSVVPVVIYGSIFAIHLSLLNKSGPGDAFMTPEFRKTLIGSTDYQNTDIIPLNITGKIVELNKQMYTSNTTLTADHPYSSKWYTWPFMQRPIYYWYSSTNSTHSTNAQGGEQSRTTGSEQTDSPQIDQEPKLESRIYFIGNPIIWWLSTVAIAYLILDQIMLFISKKKFKFVPILIIFAYILNMLPFIGISRAMFLYHYMIGYGFAILALVYLLNNLKHKKTAAISLISTALVLFIFFAPLTYGLPLSIKGYDIRSWFQGWK